MFYNNIGNVIDTIAKLSSSYGVPDNDRSRVSNAVELCTIAAGYNVVNSDTDVLNDNVGHLVNTVAACTTSYGVPYC